MVDRSPTGVRVPGRPVYAVRATALADGWQVHLPGIAVLTANRRAEVEPLVRDVLATVRGVEPETLSITVTFQVPPGAARRR